MIELSEFNDRLLHSLDSLTGSVERLAKSLNDETVLNTLTYIRRDLATLSKELIEVPAKTGRPKIFQRFWVWRPEGPGWEVEGWDELSELTRKTMPTLRAYLPVGTEIKTIKLGSKDQLFVRRLNGGEEPPEGTALENLIDKPAEGQRFYVWHRQGNEWVITGWDALSKYTKKSVATLRAYLPLDPKPGKEVGMINLPNDRGLFVMRLGEGEDRPPQPDLVDPMTPVAKKPFKLVNKGLMALEAQDEALKFDE